MQGYSLDIIARCAFGMNVSTHKNPDDELLKHGRALFSDFTSTNLIGDMFLSIFNIFPEIFSLMGFYSSSFDKLVELTTGIMAERDRKNLKVGDFIDRLRELEKDLPKHILKVNAQ